MKIENKMKYNRVKEALIRWVLGTDGQDGATCELVGVIPWGDELEAVICWDDVRDIINESFGCRTDENNGGWDAAIIFTDNNVFKRFDKFITEKTNRVMTTYQGIIDKANSLCNIKFEINVHIFVGYVNGVAKYEPLYCYFSNNLTSLANDVFNKLKVSDYENDDFIDSVHYALYNNDFVVFKSNCIDEILRLQVKKK